MKQGREIKQERTRAMKDCFLREHRGMQHSTRKDLLANRYCGAVVTGRPKVLEFAPLSLVFLLLSRLLVFVFVPASGLHSRGSLLCCWRGGPVGPTPAVQKVVFPATITL